MPRVDIDDPNMRITTTTLRLPVPKNQRLRKMALELGVSTNSLIVMLIELGLRAYSNASVSDTT